MIRAYPGDPGSHDNSTRAWQDVLVKRGALRTATGVLDADTTSGLDELREELGLGPRARWTTVWAHVQGLKAADVVDEPVNDDLGEVGGAPGA